jgi:hypothetical protein
MKTLQIIAMLMDHAMLRRMTRPLSTGLRGCIGRSLRFYSFARSYPMQMPKI